MGVKTHHHNPFPIRRLLAYVLVVGLALGLLIDPALHSPDASVATRHG